MGDVSGLISEVAVVLFASDQADPPVHLDMRGLANRSIQRLTHQRCFCFLQLECGQTWQAVENLTTAHNEKGGNKASPLLNSLTQPTQAR